MLSHVQFFATPWTVACQAPLSMEFSRQEYWSGWPFPSPGNLPNPGIKPLFKIFCVRPRGVWVLVLVTQSCPTLCDPIDCRQPASSVHGILHARIARVGCHSLLQGIFPIQGLNPHFLYRMQILYHLSHQGRNDSIPMLLWRLVSTKKDSWAASDRNRF